MNPLQPNCRCYAVPDEDLRDFTSETTGRGFGNMTWEEWRKKNADRKDGREQQLPAYNAKPPEQVKNA